MDNFCRYQRLPIKEVDGLIIDSSIERLDTFARFGPPKTKTDVINMLGDQSAKNHVVFRDEGIVRTVAMGEYAKIVGKKAILIELTKD